MDSPYWTKSKKEIINYINRYDDNCFKYAAKAAVNRKEIGEKVSKIKAFK